MTEGFWDKVLLLKGLYDQTLDPVAQRWKLTRMELDLLLFLHNNPDHATAAEAVRLRRWTKSHVSAAAHSLEEKGLLPSPIRRATAKPCFSPRCPPPGLSFRRGGRPSGHFFAPCAGTSPPKRSGRWTPLRKKSPGTSGTP